jgi:transposase
MFGLTTATRIYIAVEAIGMRKGFEGLHGLVRGRLGQDPERACVPVHESRAHAAESAGVGRQRVWVCAKRLEKGRFHWPEVGLQAEARSVTIELPAPRRSDGVRDRPGMPFGFPSEKAFRFAGIANLGTDSRVYNEKGGTEGVPTLG